MVGDLKANVRLVIQTHVSINSENLVNIGLQIQICGVLCHFSRGYTNKPRDLRGYSTEVYQISTRYSVIIAAFIVQFSNPFRNDSS